MNKKEYSFEETLSLKGVFSGVYCIKNTKNNKCYVGISNDIFKRLKQHINDLKKGYKKGEFQKDFDFFGEKNFITCVLLTSESRKEICEKEKEFIVKFDSFDNGYNLRRMQLEIPKKQVGSCIDMDLYEIVQKDCISKKTDIAKWITEAIKEKIERDELK